jgi:hypothetical protein
MMMREAKAKLKLRCTWVGLRQNWQVIEARGSSKGEGAMEPKLNKAPGEADDLLYILKMRPKYNR